MVYLIMGVAGCGKSSVGRMLSQRSGIPFLDADDFHSESNRVKMSEGVALTDEDRAEWLTILNKTIGEYDSVILACSALKRIYRTTILAGTTQHRLIYLDYSFETIQQRLIQRTDHFFPALLLKSQFELLEPPGDDESPLVVSAKTVELACETIFRKCSELAQL